MPASPKGFHPSVNKVFTQGFPSLGEHKSPAPKGETDSGVTYEVDGSLLCFAQTLDLWESQELTEERSNQMDREKRLSCSLQAPLEEKTMKMKQLSLFIPAPAHPTRSFPSAGTW